MDEKSLYAHILNLSAPWQVKSLSLDENADSVTVVVGIAKNTQLICPTCGQPCPVHERLKRQCRSAEQQNTAAQDKSERLPKQGAL